MSQTNVARVNMVERDPAHTIGKADWGTFVVRPPTVDIRMNFLGIHFGERSFFDVCTRGEVRAETSMDQDPRFPLARRMDLPAHEREISGESLRLLREGIASAIASGTTEIPAAFLLDDDEDE